MNNTMYKYFCLFLLPFYAMAMEKFATQRPKLTCTLPDIERLIRHTKNDSGFANLKTLLAVKELIQIKQDADLVLHSEKPTLNQIKKISNARDTVRIKL